MKLKNLVLVSFFLSSIIAAQNDVVSENQLKSGFSDSLHVVIKSLKSSVKQSKNEVQFKSLLLDDLSDKARKKLLEDEIEKLNSTIVVNKIEIYKTRSQLPSSDSISIKTIPDELLYNSELKNLREYVEGLKKEVKNDPSGEISKLLMDKEIELKREVKTINRKILEAFALNDLVDEESIFPERNMDELSPDVRISLQKDRKKVLDKKAQHLSSEDSKNAFKNSRITYRATILNTHFTIPIVRFNQIKGNSSKDGNVTLFNSIGAGVSYSGGRLIDIRDSNGEIIDTKFNNTFGVSVGFLFSAGSNDDEGQDDNVFAPMISLNLLDFQLGFGVELGTRTEDQRRGFFTIAYSIPLYKLTGSKFRIIKKGKIINDVIEN